MSLDIGLINEDLLENAYDILKKTIVNNNIVESQILKEIKGQNFLRQLRKEIDNYLNDKNKITDNMKK